MNTQSHSLFEDLIALLSAGILVSLGIVLFESQGLLTGGAAGIALLGTHITSVSFGALFFIVNLPFYLLAWTQIGKRFTFNTFVSVTLVSVLSENLGSVIQFERVHPAFASLLAGLLVGVGLIIMFRHKSSLGGLGILGFYLQNKFHLSAGKFQLAVDLCILCVASIYFTFELLLISIIAAVVMNVVLAVNHKPGRYAVGEGAPQQKVEQETLTELHDELQKEIDQDLMHTAK